MDKPFIFNHIKHLVNYNVFDTKWIPVSAKFVALGGKANGTGVLNVFELNEDKLDLVLEICKKSILKCGSFGASPSLKSHLAIGDFDGTLQIINIEQLDSYVYSVKAHKGIINCIDAIGGGTSPIYGSPEIVTGGRDGLVKIWDPRQKSNPVACMTPKTAAEGGNGCRDCWSVNFGNTHNNQERFVSAGYDNGDLKVFDLRQMKVFWEANVNHGICCTEFDKKNKTLNRLAVSTLEGNLQVFDFQQPLAQGGYFSVVKKDAGKAIQSNGFANISKQTVWCAQHLPQNTDLLATCGGGGVVKLWLCKNGALKMLHEVTVSNQPIHCFHWCSDHPGLAACGSFDNYLRILVTSNLNLTLS